MPFWERFFSGLRSLAAGAGSVLAGFFSKARLALDTALARLPERSRKPTLALLALIVAAAVPALALRSAVRHPAVGRNLVVSAPAAPEAGISEDGPEALPPAGDRVVATEELFLPGEPDFVPGFTPERERLPAWTPAEVRLRWQDPSADRALWRARLQAAADRILEDAP